MFRKYKMELEKILIDGTLITMGSLIIYQTYKVSEAVKRVRDSTTNFLDVATRYLASRVRSSEEIDSFIELVKTRKKYQI